LNRSRKTECTDDADTDADRGKAHPLAHDHRRDTERIGAERKANANLAGTRRPRNLPSPCRAHRMGRMCGDRRVRATWLLLVLYTGLCLGVCAIVIAKFELPCCPDVRYEEASLTACCSSDPASSELSVMIHTATPPSEMLFVVTPRATNNDPRLHNRRIPFHPSNPQALLSTFLI
jgi:hypothetical protein